MDVSPGPIRTPDQRLRVFVSSTLKELAPERKAARVAVERLRLAPVMFELGARPHPPRDLYRAYLQQSDVFIGLYWERYGWVAPGEEVSGLEDEYNLAPHLPKLIYIKEPADTREPRLRELLDRIRGDDTASFKYFSSARELGELIQADLATLLAERFDQSRLARGAERQDQPAQQAPPEQLPPSGQANHLPIPMTSLIGRESEVAAVERMLRADSIRILNLVGAGGIGKSRLAIEVAGRMAAEYPGGVYFVDLAPVDDAALVLNAIATALGVRDNGEAPIAAKIATALHNRRVLLVLDNVEQVATAAPAFTAMLGAAAGVKLLLTSRTTLRVSGEHSFPVGPLALPGPDQRPSLDDLIANPAVALFLERAHAVKPDFEVTADNADAVMRICLALDGVPLALELAAARIRVLTPNSMLERLDRRLPMLVGGDRDLPERQQTLRRTIEWSTELLGHSERALLAKLGVFEGGFFLEAAESIAAATGADTGADSSTDTITLLATLVDNSLVREQDRAGRSHFSMLATVREHARETLEAGGGLEEARSLHADYFIELGRASERQLEGPRQHEFVALLADDRDNLRAAARYLLERREWERAAAFAWTLYIYWWVGGHLGEVRGWMAQVLDAEQPLAPLTRAIALYFTRAITFWQHPNDVVIPGLTESAELFHREKNFTAEALALVSLALAHLAGESPDPARADEVLETSLSLFRESDDTWGQAMALVVIGRLALLQNKLHGALNRFEESLSLAAAQRDDLGEAIALHHLGWARLLLGEVEGARVVFERSLEVSNRLGHAEGVAYGLEGLVAIAASTGEVTRAGRLLGAAECVRERSGLFNAPAFTFHAGLVDQILAGDQAGALAVARAEGREMPVEAAVALALPAMAGRDT